MTNLPTTEQINKNNLLEVVRKLDPELYLIRIALDESGVNPMVIPKIIRTIGNLSIGTGFGKIQIFMQARIITNIKPEENVVVNESATLDNRDTE